MRVPLSWLREFVELPPDAHAVADRLAMLGFPVDAVEVRPEITGVVVGRIERLEKHPNADRLQVGQIDVGGERPLTIATAATNVAAGQTIAVATIGARLPQLTIAPRTMRGIASEGMMISAEELALPAEWFEDGILQLEASSQPGTDAVAMLGLTDAVLDVEITSNRVDAMSILGLARELAASYGATLRLPSFANPAQAVEREDAAVRAVLESPDCTRFVAQRFDDVPKGAAPAWMRVRLALAGQRPIGAAVDVSNYVMLETGQPLHFYDAARIGGNALVVRDAREGERLVTLDGVVRTLTPQSLVVASADGALGLAGVMGGETSEVSESTTTVILEAATFNGARVRRTAKLAGLRTEASARHEKSLAPAAAGAGAARAAQLLQSLGARAYRPHVAGTDLAAAAPIALTARDVSRLLGIALAPERIAGHLEALGCAVARDGDTFAVTAPPWRRDLTIAADLVEEVARVEGYDRIEASLPNVPAHEISSTAFDRERETAQALAALGYGEAITYSLQGREPIDARARVGIAADTAVEVRNPLSEDQRYLRTSLLDGLVAYLARSSSPLAAFEIGHTFAQAHAEVTERSSVAFGFSAEPVDEPAWRDDAFLRLKGDAEALLRALTGRAVDFARGEWPGLHPGKTAALSVDERSVGVLGRVDPRLSKAYDAKLALYLCILDADALPEYVLPHYAAPSRFPGTSRDLALAVGLPTSASDVERTIRTALGAICTGVRVFDEYRGPQAGDGKKSLAVRVRLQRFDATITDEQADAEVARALAALRAELGATIRE